MQFNLRIDNLEVRKWSSVLPYSTESIEIVKWIEDKGIDTAFILAHWKIKDDEYTLEFNNERPFNLNAVEKDIFWKLAMWGQTLLKRNNG